MMAFAFIFLYQPDSERLLRTQTQIRLSQRNQRRNRNRWERQWGKDREWDEEEGQSKLSWSGPGWAGVYLCVRTRTLKRLSPWANRLGPESFSTRIPEEKTSTCSESKMEETRCWWCDRRSGGGGVNKDRTDGKKKTRTNRHSTKREESEGL